MLRITVEHRDEDVVLRLEGRIADDDVELLQNEGNRVRQTDVGFILDLEGVTYVDTWGAELLRHWRRHGALLEGGSLYLRTMLEQHGVL